LNPHGVPGERAAPPAVAERRRVCGRRGAPSATASRATAVRPSSHSHDSPSFSAVCFGNAIDVGEAADDEVRAAPRAGSRHATSVATDADNTRSRQETLVRSFTLLLTRRHQPQPRSVDDLRYGVRGEVCVLSVALHGALFTAKPPPTPALRRGALAPSSRSSPRRPFA